MATRPLLFRRRRQPEDPARRRRPAIKCPTNCSHPDGTCPGICNNVVPELPALPALPPLPTPTLTGNADDDADGNADTMKMGANLTMRYLARTLSMGALVAAIAVCVAACNNQTGFSGSVGSTPNGPKLPSFQILGTTGTPFTATISGRPIVLDVSGKRPAQHRHLQPSEQERAAHRYQDERRQQHAECGDNNRQSRQGSSTDDGTFRHGTSANR